jgi:hypothetical protein
VRSPNATILAAGRAGPNMRGDERRLLGKPPGTQPTDHNFDLRFGSGDSQRVARDEKVLNRTRKIHADYASSHGKFC